MVEPTLFRCACARCELRTIRVARAHFGRKSLLSSLERQENSKENQISLCDGKFMSDIIDQLYTVARKIVSTSYGAYQCEITCINFVENF